jgi:hypothetical protein
MDSSQTPKRQPIFAVCLLALAAVEPGLSQNVMAAEPPLKFPYAEKLVYRLNWRMVTAGHATLRLTRGAIDGWQLNLDLASEGIVNQLYRVQDTYKLSTTDKFCGSMESFEEQEGKRRASSAMVFDYDRRKVAATSKNLITNATQKTELDIPGCAYEIAGALLTLRASQLAPGMKFTLPVTDGKKLASVRVEGLGKEKLTIKGVNYNSIRYETFVFDNVLYRRKGRLLIWVTDDAQRLPVQLRFMFSFPLGDITLELEKVEKL